MVRGGTPGSVGVARPQCMQNCASSGRGVWQAGQDRPVVLMDEPFSALDAITRARLQSLAAALLAGRTVLLVTHDPLEALRLGHRVHVMAGQPARIEAPIVPAGAPPRDLHDPDLLRLQGDLLAALADADLAA